MPSTHSRRDVLAKGVLAGAALAAPALAMPQAGPIAGVLDAELAKPLSDEARMLASEQLKSIDDRHRERLKTKLPENSEPCFTFVPTLKDGTR